MHVFLSKNCRELIEGPSPNQFLPLHFRNSSTLYHLCLVFSSIFWIIPQFFTMHWTCLYNAQRGQAVRKLSEFSLPKGSGSFRILSFKTSIFSDESLSFLFAFLKLNAALTCRYRVFGEGGSPTRNICTKKHPCGSCAAEPEDFCLFWKM